MPPSGLKVGVVFGGRSVEHDVSIITGLQASEALSERHTPVPIYIDRDGCWLVGDALRDVDAFRAERIEAQEFALDLRSGLLLAKEPEPRGLLRRGESRASIRLDVVVNATHGTQGEDGCLQGVLELARIPYTGPSVEAAAVAMNKAATKALLRDAGLRVLGGVTMLRGRWDGDRRQALAWVEGRLDYPVYAKPASLGSSIGVSRCGDGAELDEALELIFELDRQAVIEPSVEGGMEVNCSVLGRPGAPARASVCEQPIASTEFLSFDDKYMREAKGGTDARGMQSAARIVPARIEEGQTVEAQRLAIATFEALGCAGVARVDLLLDGEGRMYVNECNTVPGSFSFYLWEPAGVNFSQLMDELIDLAQAEHAERARTLRTFESNLLAARSAGSKA